MNLRPAVGGARTPATARRRHARELLCAPAVATGLGSFITGQIIADVKYAGVLKSAADWTMFAVPGPGSRRGLNRALGRDKNAPWQEADWRHELGKLQRLLEPRWHGAGMEPPHAQDLQNALCEWDKHERMRFGDGKPKQRYDGG